MKKKILIGISVCLLMAGLVTATSILTYDTTEEFEQLILNQDEVEGDYTIKDGKLKTDTYLNIEQSNYSFNNYGMWEIQTDINTSVQTERLQWGYNKGNVGGGYGYHIVIYSNPKNNTAEIYLRQVTDGTNHCGTEKCNGVEIGNGKHSFYILHENINQSSLKATVYMDGWEDENIIIETIFNKDEITNGISENGTMNKTSRLWLGYAYTIDKISYSDGTTKFNSGGTGFFNDTILRNIPKWLWLLIALLTLAIIKKLGD